MRPIYSCLITRAAFRRGVLLYGSRLLAIFVLLVISVLSSAKMFAQAANQITQNVDFARQHTLANHHPLWAASGNDAGLVAQEQILDQMTLVLARSAEQEAAFQQLLADLEDPASPNYHHWLTPTEVGERFGLSDQDIAALTDWLQSQGLHVNWVSPSKTFIGFGGTAADLGRALHTEFHSYNVHGEQRISVASDPIVPEALAPAILAIHGLYTIKARPAHHIVPMLPESPDATASDGSHFIAPADFATIYDLPSNLTGAGQTIGIVGRARTDMADFNNFKSRTSSSFTNPTEIVPTAFGGIDPGAALTAPPTGSVDVGDQGEATLDVMRAGSVAPGATLKLVISADSNSVDGIGADVQYLVQTTPIPAQVMTISFGACESEAGRSGVNYWDGLFQQAASEGISVFVSSGDSGASGCDAAFTTPPTSPAANSPNYLCSSSYVTCVGGTEFNDASNSSTYWNTSNGTGFESAKSYIPEGGWNESLITGSPATVAGSGGGVSTIISTPSWQTGTGVPAARSGRYTPDVSFSASDHDGYFGCMAAESGSCVSSGSGGYPFLAFSGTSAAAPDMAGVAALLDQKLGAAQGNLNPTLYTLAGSTPTAFHDVTVASSGVSSCSVNTASMCNNTIPGQAGFLVTTGYDEVTGLGSLDVNNFLGNVTAKLTPTVTVAPSLASMTVMQALPVTVTVSGGNGNPIPAGTVILVSGSFGSLPATLVNGVATVTIPAQTLTAGTDTLTGYYTPSTASSTTYSVASGSNTVTVSLLASIVTVTPSSSNITTAQSLTVPVSVSGGSSNPTPTGSVSLSGGGYTGSATLSGGNATFNLVAGMLVPGSDTLTATYTPDIVGSAIYQSGSNTSSVTVTAAAKYTPTVTLAPSVTLAARAEPLPVTITVNGAGGPSTPTGTITLIDGSYSSLPATLAGGTAIITIPAGTMAVGTNSLTAVYAPDTASAPIFNNTSATTSISVVNPAISTPTMSITPASPSITIAQSLTLTVTLSTSGSFPNITGTVKLSGAYTAAPVALVNNSATFTIPAGSLAAGTDAVTISYTPDASSSAIFLGTANSINVTVTGPSFTVAGTAVSLKAGATTGNTSTITVTPTLGFTGNVTLTATIAGPAGAQYPPTLSFGTTSPVSLTTASPATATLTITTTNVTSTSQVDPGRRGLPWYAAGGTTLACLLLFGIPARRRAIFAMLLLLVALAGGVLACGGNSGTTTTSKTSSSVTTSGTYVITVTGTSSTVSIAPPINLTVQ